jgi:hypothetical protein
MVYLPYVMADELSQLEKSVAFYRSEVERAREAVERAQTTLTGAERDLQIALNFLEIERRRLAATNGAKPYKEMPLRDACVAIVRKKGRATTREIVDALKAGGFEFETEFPGRAIHTALMRAKDVRKVASGTYEVEEARLL